MRQNKTKTKTKQNPPTKRKERERKRKQRKCWTTRSPGQPQRLQAGPWRRPALPEPEGLGTSQLPEASFQKVMKQKTKISFCPRNSNDVLNRFFLGISRRPRPQGMPSVHPLPAVHGPAVTRNLVLVVFKVKLIVIAKLPAAKTQYERGWRGTTSCLSARAQTRWPGQTQPGGDAVGTVPHLGISARHRNREAVFLGRGAEEGPAAGDLARPQGTFPGRPAGATGALPAERVWQRRAPSSFPPSFLT